MAKTVFIGLRCKKCNNPLHEEDQAWWVEEENNYIAGLTCANCTPNAWVIKEEGE